MRNLEPPLPPSKASDCAHGIRKAGALGDAVLVSQRALVQTVAMVFRVGHSGLLGRVTDRRSDGHTSLARRVGGAFRRVVRACAHGLVPPTCLACDARVDDQGMVCATCWQDITFLDRPWCAVTGVPFSYDPGPGALSPQAIAFPPPFEKARAAVLYTGKARTLVHGLKFSDRSDLAPWMAAWMLRAADDVVEDGAVVIPVPLHPRRLWQRRSNQSADLGRYFARLAALPYHPDWLMRIKATRQQVGLGLKARQRNVQGAFRVPQAARAHLKGRTVLLIDDVFTTGATLNSCTRALQRAGAARVNCLTFARVAPELD